MAETCQDTTLDRVALAIANFSVFHEVTREWGWTPAMWRRRSSKKKDPYYDIARTVIAILQEEP